ncbi:MAG: SPASM domain-containing protein, partial [Paramuribaculum sp.]|nr:SPASM domain-containing protein [Paramuribaculum sp.]
YGTFKEGVTNERVLYDYLAGADQFEDETCKECIMLPICPGGCPHTRLVDERSGTRNACPLNVRNLKDYLWEHYKVIQKRNEKREPEKIKKI